MKLIFYSTSGLETVSLDELKLFNIKSLNYEVKRIIGEYSHNFQSLRKLRTIDDIGLLISEFKISKDTTNKELVSKILNFELLEIIKPLQGIRDLNESFSITISKYKPVVEIKDFKDLLANGFKAKFGYAYTERTHENLDLRVNMDKDKVIVSVRVFEQPLYQRDYVISKYLGALKPTIAASLVLLVKNKLLKLKSNSQFKLLDLFCGSGTILCEAYVQGFEVYGSDINPAASEITIKQLQNNGLANPNVKEHSAYTTSWQTNEFDCIISNLPWNTQVTVENIEDLYARSFKEMARVLNLNSVICLLGKKPDLIIKYIKKYFPEHKVEMMKLSFKGQQPYVVLAIPK